MNLGHNIGRETFGHQPPKDLADGNWTETTCLLGGGQESSTTTMRNYHWGTGASAEKVDKLGEVEEHGLGTAWRGATNTLFEV